VAQKAKENPRPENCNLETKLVNPEIWSNIVTTSDRSLDLQLQKSQKLISKATYAVLKSTNSVISLKKDKKKRKELIKGIMKNSTDAIALLTTAHNHNEQLRRELLLKRLAREQRSLGKDIPVDAKHLFGDDLNKKLTEAAGVNKLKPWKGHLSRTQTASRSSYSKNWTGPQKSSGVVSQGTDNHKSTKLRAQYRRRKRNKIKGN